jgi:pyruvate formate lyase activating enzyme
MARCGVCGVTSRRVSGALGVCGQCLREGKPEGIARAREAHRACRAEFGLPTTPPRDGRACGWCANNCRIPDGGLGYCAVRRIEGGTLRGGTATEGRVSWYYDPLPTNCVADWVCAGSRDRGRRNLAVFYEACSFDCLFCQNWHYREKGASRADVPADALAEAADATTACICYFGGDPSPQMDHALAASRLAIGRAQGQPPRICWETNGSMSRKHLAEAAQLSLETDGCIKFDLKAWNPDLHLGLCGVGNERTLENFAWLAELGKTRPEPPLLVASTLLVPGYVDVEEVRPLAEWIARLDPAIPYSLLGFHPDFHMADLPCTSRHHAEECLDAARVAGLQRLHVGNSHVLGPRY